MTNENTMFPAVTGNPTFYRSYSRRLDNGRESWASACDRVTTGLAWLGELTAEETELLFEQQYNLKSLTSGRWMWVGGTKWLKQQENFSGAYNCSSTNVVDWGSFGLLMDLAMMGCGTGAVLTEENINQLPTIINQLDISVVDNLGTIPKSDRLEKTQVFSQDNKTVDIFVGDSRIGWVESYQKILELSSDTQFDGHVRALIHLSNVRPAGEPLQGFGGVSNPVKLADLYSKLANILNGANGRKLNSLECCLLTDEAMLVVVAGNLRRSASMRQAYYTDKNFANAKANLWQQGEDGNWRIDPKRDALRMANHTMIYDKKPSLDECIESVRSQFYTGEGAIQWAGEALARANADLLKTQREKSNFLAKYSGGGKIAGQGFLTGIYHEKYGKEMDQSELTHRMNRVGLNPCLHGDTLVKVWEPNLLSGGWTLKPIRVLAESDKFFWVMDGEKSLCPVRFAKTQANVGVVKITFQYGDTVSSVTATLGHHFFKEVGMPSHEIKEGTWGLSKDWVRKNHLLWERTTVEDLQVGDVLLGELEFAYPWTIIDIENAGHADVYCTKVPTTKSFDLELLHSGNCGEIIGSDYHCNLSEVHLNRIDPFDFHEQEKALIAASLSVAALLNHRFAVPRYQKSRELDPIVGVSFTGLFDFFVNAIGADWLRWWEAGRPEEWSAVDNLQLWATTNCFPEEPDKGNIYKRVEAFYLNRWRHIVELHIRDYCNKHQLKTPNRFTCVQPAGTKSLLTNASPGWHPPFGKYYIRRITFAKDDPVALACLDAGYAVVPGQSDKDENGALLNDPFDSLVTEWLVEFPVEVSWANMPGVEDIAVGNYSAIAQFDFYMQVQKYWTTHNTSATILLTEDEVEPLGTRIYEAIRDDEGYISAALLARFDAPFPRLPFEAITKSVYLEKVAEVEAKRRTDGDFAEWMDFYSAGKHLEVQDSACSGLKCEVGYQATGIKVDVPRREYLPNLI